MGGFWSGKDASGLGESEDKWTARGARVRAVSDARKRIAIFQKRGDNEHDATPIALDMEMTTCVTISKLTGETLIQTIRNGRRGAVVVTGTFEEALDIWREVDDVVIFHSPSREGDGTFPCALPVRSISSIETSRKTGETLVNTVNGIFVVTESFNEAVAIWRA